jgi:Flp pilus assembly protein TadG
MTSIAGRRIRHDGETGSVSLLLVVLLLAVFAVFGLVVDGGARLDAQRRATDQAEQAARAAAQAINPTSLRDSGTATLDPAAAQAAAARYLAAAGNLTLTGVHVTGTTVTVNVTTTVQPAVLSLIGLHTLTVTGTGRAQLLRGNTAMGTP